MYTLRMNNFEILLWDLDGTVNDFLATENYAIKKGMKRIGFENCTDEMVAVYSKINVSYWEKLERGEMSKPEILVGRFKDFFKAYGISEDYAEDFNTNYQIDLGDKLVFIDGAPEVLQKIKSEGKIRQFVVTNGLAVNQQRKLNSPELKDIFEYAFISDEVGYEKPTVQFFDAVFAKIEASDKKPVDRSKVLIIGDSLTSDIRGGNNAGIRTCWFNPRGKVNDKGVKVDFEVRNLREVLKIFR